MLFSRGIFVLTICIGASYAATTVGFDEMFSGTVKNATVQDSPLNEMGDQYLIKVTKGIPDEPDKKEQVLKVTAESEQTTEEKTRYGGKSIQSSHTNMKTFKDEERTTHKSGPVSTTNIDKETLQKFDASRTTEGHSQLGDSRSQATIDGVKDSIVEGTMKTQNLGQNGKMTTAQLHNEKSNEMHLTGEHTRTFHIGSDYSVTVENEFDQSTNVNAETNRDVTELTRKNRYTDTTVRNNLDTTNTTDATTSSHTQTTAVNTPGSQSLTGIHKTEKKTSNSLITEEKTTVMHRTPLSKLLIKDNNKEQTENDHKKTTTNSVTIADDRNGTMVAKTVNTTNKIDKKTQQHFNQFTLQKTPTNGSKSLPLTVVLSTNGIDNQKINAETTIDKSENTETPDGTKNTEYNKHVITKYAFKTIPPAEKKACKNSGQNNATTTQTADKATGDISLGINLISQSQLSRPSAQIIPPNMIEKLTQTDNETSDTSISFEDFLPLELNTSEISATDKSAQTIPQQHKIELQPTLKTVHTVKEPEKFVQQPEQNEHSVRKEKIEQQPDNKIEQQKKIGQQPEMVEQSVRQPENIAITVPHPIKLEEKTNVPEKSTTRQETNKEDQRPKEFEKKTGAENNDHSVKADDINVNYGTMLLLLPRTQTDDKNVFIESIADKYSEFIYYIRKHKLASKVLFAEVGNVTTDQSDEFLYTFSREENVYVAEVDPIMETVEIDKLSSQKEVDSSFEEDESSDETASKSIQ